MASFFCSRCSSTVEDKDGYCLLGHPTPETAEESPMADIRREVDDAFGDQLQGLELLLAPVRAANNASPPEPSPGRPSLLPSPDDPITAFAPPPRMDWGPAQTRLRRLLQRASRSED